MTTVYDSILAAAIEPRLVDGHRVSRNAQRVVLLMLAARSAHLRPLRCTVAELAVWSDLSLFGVRLAVQALESAGLLSVAPGRPNRYAIETAALERLPARTVPA